MINFYRKTATLWTLTRVLIILLLIVSAVITYLQVGFYLGSAISFFFIGIYLVLLATTLFRKADQASGSPLLLTTGIFTSIYALLALMSIVKIHIYFSGAQLALMVVFSLWLLLFGFGDILNVRRNASVEP